MEEGSETHGDTNGELTFFLLHGVVAWLRLNPAGQERKHDKWTNLKFYTGNLAILLVNMMES